MHTNNAANFALKVHFILKNVLQTTIGIVQLLLEISLKKKIYDEGEDDDL